MPRQSRQIYWSAILADFRRSGLTHVEFCRRRHISIHSFRSWLYRRRPEVHPKSSHSQAAPSLSEPAPSTTPAFLPVRILPEPIPATGAPHDPRATPLLELVLADHRRIRISPGFDRATLHQLLDLLEERP
jgi:hypothetical protein